jgi:hypothetical protein
MKLTKKLFKNLLIIVLLNLVTGCDFCDGKVTYEKWPGGIVPYYIDQEIYEDYKNTIKTAFEIWDASTNIICIKLENKERKLLNKRHYVHIKSVDRDSMIFTSSLGNKSKNYILFDQNYLDRKDRYIQKSLVKMFMHEIGHIVGLTHMHTATYRNNYIKVLWENIIPDKKFNFYIKRNPFIDYTKWEYDYESIMHYLYDTFSKSYKPTLISLTKKPIPYFWIDVKITKIDIEKVNAIYFK